jgi:hypothetical protein
LAQDVHPPVRIFLEQANNLRRASDDRKPFALGPHNTEGTLASQAFADHLFVAALEDVEWQRRTGKEHNFKREQRNLHAIAILRMSAGGLDPYSQSAWWLRIH